MAKRGRSRSKATKPASRAQTGSPASSSLNATAPAFTPGAAIDSKIAIGNTPHSVESSILPSLNSEERRQAFKGNPLVIQARGPPTNPQIQATMLSPVMDSPRRQNFTYHPELRQLVFGKRLQSVLDANHAKESDAMPMYGADGGLLGTLGTPQELLAMYTAPQRYSSDQLLQMRTTQAIAQPRPTIYMAPQKYTLAQLFYIGRKMWGLEG